MDLTRYLLRIADAYCQATGLSRSRVATLALNDGKFFTRLEAGGGFTNKTYAKAVAWFQAHWPADEPWPEAPAAPAAIPTSEAA